MESLQSIAACIGVTGTFSVARDFFGFLRGAPSDVSVATQIARLKGQHLHINFIRVGSDQFTNDDMEEMDSALQFTRDTYATVSLGIGRVGHYSITTAEADGAENIDNDSEARILTRDWTVPNSALDIFWVLTYASSTIGYSAINGPCNKNIKIINGSVVAVESDVTMAQLTLAHEVAHYLGLRHISDPFNLMWEYTPNGGNLTDEQGASMRNHCFTKPGC